MTTTRLIIVSGASASGKTSLAMRLHETLDYPLLSKDIFKEAMMNVLPPKSREDSGIIGRLAWPALFTAANELVGHVPGLIIEANFYRTFHTESLRDLASQASAVLVRCLADRETTVTRIEGRLSDPDRHEGHFDQEGIDVLLRQIDAGEHLIELTAVATFDIDTGGDDPAAFETLVNDIRHAAP